VSLFQAHPERNTIAGVNSIIYQKSYDVALIKRLAELLQVSEIGRTLFAQRLEEESNPRPKANATVEA
jgi:hypothetical protein